MRLGGLFPHIDSITVIVYITVMVMNEEWTLEQFSEGVAEELRTRNLLGASHDGRVSAAPDARTIRYYTTLGLLDRPKIAGRDARYNRRHLLQIVAIKALQALGLPLSEIQARLYGRSNEELEALLEAASGQVPATEYHPLVWRELAIEPGLKILAEEGWAPHIDSETLIERMREALSVLQKKTEKIKKER